jgi:hypothetical protein
MKQISRPIGTVNIEIKAASVAKLMSQLKLMPKTKQPLAGPPEPPMLQPGIKLERTAKMMKIAGKTPATKSPVLVDLRDMFPSDFDESRKITKYLGSLRNSIA